MFIQYNGPAQAVDSRVRRAVASHKAKRQSRQSSLTGRYKQQTFVWRPEVRDNPRRDPGPHLVVPPKEEEEDPPKHTILEKFHHKKFQQVLKAPTSIINIGGLRTDPFESYPITARSYFPGVVDFYLHVISPNPSAENHPFTLILSDGLLFESIVALTLCVMPPTVRSRQMAVGMLDHHGSTLKALNKRLSLPSPEQCASDTVILTVAVLIATNASIGNNEKFDMHIKGLRQLVKLRGGLDNLGQGGHVKSIVLGAEALASLSKAPRKQRPVQVHSPAALEYPTHPFPPDLCAAIAALPEGVRELALTGRLSVQLIQRLDLSRSQLAGLLADADPDQAQTEHWNKLIKSCTHFERTVWLSLVTYHLRSATYRSDLNRLASGIMQPQFVDSRAEQEWLLWARTVVAGSSEQDLDAETRRRVLERLFEEHAEARDWAALEKVARKFYWNETLAEEVRKYWLEEKMRRAPFPAVVRVAVTP